MPILRFPDPSFTTPEGILAVGGDLHPDSLTLAYRQGIFPWPIEGAPLTWFCPSERGILEFKDLHIPRSLSKIIRKKPFRLTLDQAFDQVIEGCAQARPETWITPQIDQAYRDYHRLGLAHSAEAWLGDRLVGGIYGVDAGGAFAGESMFFTEPYASKLALLHLIEHLKSRNLEWIDIQVMTPHMEAFGAKLIPRSKFLNKLKQTQELGLKLF